MLLEMKVTRNYNKGTITLSQAHYIDTMLFKFGMNNTNPVSTPLDLNVKLDQTEAGTALGTNKRGPISYVMIIRSLMYTAMARRPDITYSVQCLAQFTRNPEPKHWTAGK